MSKNHKYNNHHHNNYKENNKNNIDTEKQQNTNDSPPVDPYIAEEPAEDLQPPQDMNLKLQLERENSIALTKMLQQLQADFDNYRKRNAKLEIDAYNKGIAYAAKAILPSYDAVDNALKHITDEQTKQGLEMVEREFINSLKEINITPIEAVGKSFDPNLHNAILSEEVEGVESGIVLDEMQKGFVSPNGVIRHSMVKVAK